MSSYRVDGGSLGTPVLLKNILAQPMTYLVSLGEFSVKRNKADYCHQYPILVLQLFSIFVVACTRDGVGQCCPMRLVLASPRWPLL